jgi:hypothetical protein
MSRSTMASSGRPKARSRPTRVAAETAAARVAWIHGAGREAARQHATMTSRRRVSDDRLAGVLDAYEQGGIDAVVTREHISTRQAYRLVARARELAGRGAGGGGSAPWPQRERRDEMARRASGPTVKKDPKAGTWYFRFESQHRRPDGSRR